MNFLPHFWNCESLITQRNVFLIYFSCSLNYEVENCFGIWRQDFKLWSSQGWTFQKPGFLCSTFAEWADSFVSLTTFRTNFEHEPPSLTIVFTVLDFFDYRLYWISTELHLTILFASHYSQILVHDYPIGIKPPFQFSKYGICLQGIKILKKRYSAASVN